MYTAQSNLQHHIKEAHESRPTQFHPCPFVDCKRHFDQPRRLADHLSQTHPEYNTAGSASQIAGGSTDQGERGSTPLSNHLTLVV